MPKPASVFGPILFTTLLGCSGLITPAATTYPVEAGLDFSRLATMKRGESCSTTILGIFGPNGDATVATAARAGGIAQVRYVDNRIRNYILWYRFCVVAYGE
jgi:TRL-like protein family